jgi:hypothetical protein
MILPLDANVKFTGCGEWDYSLYTLSLYSGLYGESIFHIRLFIFISIVKLLDIKVLQNGHLYFRMSKFK